MKQELPSIVSSYDELLMLAKEEPIKKKVTKWSLLAPTVIELHDNKNFSFEEIGKWILLRMGIKASTTSVYQAYRRYKNA